ncbi:MAG: YfhO family protein [Lachnospiraceae bacterium]|nr:YfhO family protein [Lachnospiraceae bacterium]
MNKTKSSKALLYCLSFLIPFIIAFLVFYSNDISGFPFSYINTVLVYDLEDGMIPLYSYLANLGNGFNTLFFSTTSGLGGDFFGGFAFYVSPTDFIYSLVPLDYLPDAIFWSIVIKIGLVGLSFFAFTQKSKKINVSAIFALVISSCYALMSYNFAYSSMPMWADMVILLPVLALFVEKQADGENSLAFVFLTAFTIIDNYYIAYMVIITLGIFFLFNLLENKTEIKHALLNCFRFTYHILLSVCISMVVLLPVAFNLMGGKLAGSSDKKTVSLIINSLGSVIRAMFSMNYSNLELNQAPNIFCGSLIIVFVLLWFVSKEKVRPKILASFVLFIYLASFVFGFPNVIWHGFSAPVGYCSRFSFTFSFFLLYFACRFLSLESLLKAEIFIKYKNLFCFVFCIFTYVELFMNDSFIIANIQQDYTYQNRNEYLRSIYTHEITFSGINNDDGIYRCAKNFVNTSVDGMMFGYNDLAYYNSSFNVNVISFLKQIGLYTQYNIIGDSGLTPPTASLLGEKYYVSYNNDSFDYYELMESYNIYHVFRNNNAFPIAFLCGNQLPDVYPEFSYDPFHNINTVYDDLVSPTGQLFTQQDYDLTDDEKGFGFSFVPEKDGHYFFYRTEDINLDLFNIQDVYGHPMLYFSVNGENVGGYSLFNNRYIADIGYLKAGETVNVTLETNVFDTGKILLYYYDSDAMAEISENVSGFDVTYAGWHGLTLNGNTDSERDLVVTLPYERGYNISVNGEKAEYDSYRDTFLVLHLDEGNNEIKINYIPHGFKTGLVLSLIGVILSVVVLGRKEKKVTEQQ